MLKIKSDLKNYGIIVPTSINEINTDYFEKLLKDVEVAEHYSLLAICYKDKLFNCVMSVKNKSDISIDITPIIAKSNKYKTCDRPIIDALSIERGTHFYVPNNINSFTSVGKYCADDKDLYMSIMNGSYFKTGNETNNEAKNNAPDCYFIEYKVIPNCDIKAVYSKDAKFESIMKF